MTFNIDHAALAEKRARRYLQRHDHVTQSFLYHAACGPYYCVTKAQFGEIVQQLAGEGFLELLAGASGATWCVRKDRVAWWRQQQDVTVQP